MQTPKPHLPRLDARLGRALAVLAWLAMAAQAVGVPIHLAVEEHAAHGHSTAHVHFGRFGHLGDHHHADADHVGHSHPRAVTAETPRPLDAPCQRADLPPLPPHSALDHLIDTIAPRMNAASTETPSVALAVLGFALPPLAPIDASVGAGDLVAPERPPPRRPEQSRAPPAFPA